MARRMPRPELGTLPTTPTVWWFAEARTGGGRGVVASTRHMMGLLVRVYSLEPVICSPRGRDSLVGAAGRSPSTQQGRTYR